MLPGVAMYESLLTKFVQYSLAIVEFSTVKSDDGVELSYSYLRPSVDPLVAHFAWKKILEKESQWQDHLIQVLRELVSTHVASTTFGVLFEPIAVGVLLSLFQISRKSFLKISKFLLKTCCSTIYYQFH
ncbi:hypothetical protein GEMRC1_008191 [Eukaryota sp. GEM-RC1]